MNEGCRKHAIVEGAGAQIYSYSVFLSITCLLRNNSQLGWDGASEESWDALRARLFSKTPVEQSSSSTSSPLLPVATDSGPSAAKGRRSGRQFQKSPGALPLLPPKIKASPLSSEYRTLKFSLHRAEQRATDVLQTLESNLAESDHMITLDPRWISHFTENHDENSGPDPFEIAIQQANKMLDFLNQKQREQEACEAMMIQLLDAFNAAESVADVKDFGQVVRPSNIADATGDWNGLQSDFEIKVQALDYIFVTLMMYSSSRDCSFSRTGSSSPLSRRFLRGDLD